MPARIPQFDRRHAIAGLAAVAAVGGIFVGYELAEPSNSGRCGWHRVAWYAGFPGRDSARTFWLGGRLFMSNGYRWGGAAIRDLWSTSDGVRWEIVTPSTPYEAYSAIATVGMTIYALYSEMWKSTDAGLRWTKILPSLPFKIETHSPLLVHQGVLTIIAMGSVWTYDERSNAWTQIGRIPGPRRRLSQGVVFKNAMWVIGGSDFNAPNLPLERGYRDYTTLNDVWKSTDGGANWTEVLPNMPCAPRMWPTSCVHDDRLFLMGGYDNLTGERNFTDTFFTSDGEHWHVLPVSNTFTERHAAISYSLNGSLYIAAGNANPNGKTMSDIWRLDGICPDL